MDISELADDFLEHHGIKGQRWGVRRERTSTSGVLSRISGKPELKSDEKWRNRTIRSKVGEVASAFNPNAGGISRINRQVQKATIKAMKPDIKALNKTPEYNTRQARKEIKAAGLGKLHKNKSGVVDKYYEEHGKIFDKHVRQQAPKYMQTSPSGKWETKLYVSKGGRGPWTVYVKQTDKAKHAADDNPDLVIRLRPIFDNDGFIIDWESVDEDMAQSAIDDILAHHGVKGMRWGVRRDRPSAVTVSTKGKKLKTKGGYGRPAHEDAVRARTSGQVGKKSGVQSLSNQELKAFNERLNLEQNYKRLSFEDQSAGKKFVLKVIGKKGPKAIETGVTKGGTLALNSARARRAKRLGAAAIALA